MTSLLLQDRGASESERWHVLGFGPGSVSPSSLLRQDRGASESERWHALGAGPQRH